MHFSRETVAELLASGGFFWLDLDRPEADDFEILREVFGFHPLAVEDSEQFDQRAKIEDYDDFVFLVVYGASPDDDRLVEVHCFYSERFLVTVHQDDCPAFAEIRRRYQRRDEAIDRPLLLLSGSSTGSSTASSRSWPTSTTGSTSSRTRSSARPATSSCRRSSR
jgi:Mg2+ and Co2+ transporter CorA